jgi:hypothetical protein
MSERDRIWTSSWVSKIEHNSAPSVQRLPCRKVKAESERLVFGVHKHRSAARVREVSLLASHGI